MFKSVLSILASTVIGFSPLAVSPLAVSSSASSEIVLASREDFESGSLNVFPSYTGSAVGFQGSWWALSSSTADRPSSALPYEIYMSPNDFPVPEDRGPNFTAYVAVECTSWPVLLDSEVYDPLILNYRSVSFSDYHVSSSFYTVSSTSSPSLWWVRCYFYNGQEVPASTPCPLMLAVPQSSAPPYDGGRGALSLLAFETLSQDSLDDDFVVPCLSTAAFVPPYTSIPYDGPLGFLYNMGLMLSGSTEWVGDVLNFSIFGYPLYSLMFGAGFILVLGWTVLRFVIP